MWRFVFLGCSLLVLGFSVADAGVYFWKDDRGLPHFGDRPGVGARRLDLEVASALYKVARVFDGDTILLDKGQRVRLAGINTPEVETDRKPGEAGGESARRVLARLVLGRKVRLQFDKIRRDKYRRLLAYVFSEKGQAINEFMVKQGLATVSLFPPNLRYAERLLKVQKTAEKARLGIWGDAAYRPVPVRALRGSRSRGWRRLTGKVGQIKDGRKYARLKFFDWMDVRIPKHNLHLFPPLDSYVGAELEIRGWVSRRGEHYSVLVRHPSALVRVDSP